jgi:transcriptional regulator with XRE-family HTH domain
MTKAFGRQITEARVRYGLSQIKISRLVGRSQWWLSAVERERIPITESVANKVLLAIHRAGQLVQALSIPASELADLRLEPRSNAKNFKNPKT